MSHPRHWVLAASATVPSLSASPVHSPVHQPPPISTPPHSLQQQQLKMGWWGCREGRKKKSGRGGRKGENKRAAKALQYFSKSNQHFTGIETKRRRWREKWQEKKSALEVVVVGGGGVGGWGGGQRGYCENYQTATHTASPWREIYCEFVFGSEIHHGVGFYLI